MAKTKAFALVFRLEMISNISGMKFMLYQVA